MINEQAVEHIGWLCEDIKEVTTYLTDQIEDQDRQKCQQVRGKCQVIVRSKLCLEIKLCQRQCVLSCA